MTVLNYLLTAVLLVAAVQCVPLQDNQVSNVEKTEEPHYRLPTCVVPIHYNVRLIPHIVEGNFTTDGETSIDIKVREPTNVIVLNTEDLKIDETQTRVTRKFEEDVNTVPNYVPVQHDYNEQARILTVRFEESLDPGTYTLYFKFEGVITDDLHGFYKSFYTDKEGNKVWLAATHFQPTSARQAFPCWDEPAIKATFKFSIKHYPNYTALSNMGSKRSEVDTIDGKVWTYFDTTPIMSTNVLGFVIADYDHVSNLDNTIRIWAPKHLLSFAAYPLDIAEKATRELEKFTNSTIVVPKMDHVSIPHYSSRATENWGMIVYRDDVLLYNETIPPDNQMYASLQPIIHKVHNIMTITHELAHQWFGNLVSPAWWDYLWLSEGTATYLKYYITDKFLKEWRLMDTFPVNEVQLMFDWDEHKFVQPIHINVTWNVYTAYSINTYTKSAIMLRMMSHFLREDVFQNGLIKYIQTHEYSSVTPDDLWKALQDALDESDVPHDDFKVKKVMDTWFDQLRYPIVTIDRDYTTGEIKATQKVLQSERFNNTEEDSAAWWIPLNFATQSNPDFSSTLATHWLSPQNRSITFEGVDVNDWIIVNKQLTGYYRVYYDTTNWKRLAAFLNSGDYAKIHVVNRLQIISDAFHMTKNGYLDLVTFLEIISYLSRETDPLVWCSVFGIFEKLHLYWTVPEVVAIAKPYFLNLTHELLEHIGFDERSSDDPATLIVRSGIGHYICMYGHPKCQAVATATLLAYIEDPIANKISPDQRWILRFGLMKANESVWSQFLQARGDTLEMHLRYLGSTENLDIIQKHWDYVTTEDLRYSTNIYYSNIFRNILKIPSNTETAIDIFIANFDEIAAHMSQYDWNSILNKIIWKCTKEDQINKIKSFAVQRGININDINDLNDITEEELTKIKNNLSKVLTALEDNQFSVTKHIIENDVS